MLQENISLRPFNTFGMDVRARWFARFKSVAALRTLLREPVVARAEKLILGGGSNLLLTQDFAGVVLKNEITDLLFLPEPTDRNIVIAHVGGGVGWHELVEKSLAQELSGLENLSLIPGTVGAAPLQNIGAYGVELREVFAYLDAVEIATGRERRFTAQECRFGYRESIFKNELRGQYVVVYVGLRLHRNVTTFRTDYGDIRQQLTTMGVADEALSARHISAAVVQIRRLKLPDPAEIGNAGSFFKNPEISVSQFEALKARFPAVPGYLLAGGERVKVPAGWLIEQAGWKGHRRGGSADSPATHGVHNRQALVLVNHGGAQGAEVWALAQEIIASVEEKFGVVLTPEVNVL